MTLEFVFFKNCNFLLADRVDSGSIKRPYISQTPSDSKANQFAQIMFLKHHFYFKTERKHYDVRSLTSLHITIHALKAKPNSQAGFKDRALIG